MRFRCLGILWLIGIIAVVSSSARGGGEDIINEISVSSLFNLMHAEGYSVVMGEENSLCWKIDSLETHMRVKDEGGSLHFFCQNIASGITLENINQWNLQKYYAKSYMKGEVVCFELDFDVSGGVCVRSVVEFLKLCRVSVCEWNTYLAMVISGAGEASLHPDATAVPEETNESEESDSDRVVHPENENKLPKMLMAEFGIHAGRLWEFC